MNLIYIVRISIKQKFHDSGKPVGILSVGSTRADTLPSVHLRVEALVGETLRRVTEKKGILAEEASHAPTHAPLGHSREI